MQAAVPDFQQNFFQLFSLPQSFRLDRARLESQFHALQSQVHPDKFAHLPEAERRVSMQWATRANEAYQTLRSPVRRARYLLSLHGVDTQEETNTAMPRDFLVQQMEWREMIESALQARDGAALEALESRLRLESGGMEESLASDIDDECDFAAAAGKVRKLRFLEKLAEEISSAYDEIEN
jgi:molecular chaperone HscB